MKIRLGFVSNSSSSSYTLIGVERDYMDFSSGVKPALFEFLLKWKEVYVNFAIKHMCCNGEYDDFKEECKYPEIFNEEGDLDHNLVTTPEQLQEVLNWAGFPKCSSTVGDEFFDNLGFEVEFDSDSEWMLFGKSIFAMRDDQTLGDFKKGIHDSVAKYYEFDETKFIFDSFVVYE